MATHLQTRHSKYVLEHDMKSQTNTLKVDTYKNTSYGEHGKMNTREATLTVLEDCILAC